MDISYRLQEIAAASKGEVVADIGCDHGYAACLAIKQGAKKAYACDLRKGPLENAAKTIAGMNLENQVFPRLQNGVQNLPDDVDEVIISGMGGTLICEILSELQKPGYENVTRLVLSPHKDAYALRKWLYENGFTITGEKWILDGHFYPVMSVIRRQSPMPKDEELYFGVNPQINAARSMMLEKRKKRLEEILSQMKDPDSSALIKEYKALLNLSENNQ